MNKKIIIGILIVFVIVIVGIGGYFLLNNNNKTNESENTSTNNPTVNESTPDDNEEQDGASNDTDTLSNGKTLVVYYSASGSTEKVAKEIAQNLNADLFEVEALDTYTSDDLNWTDSNSRVNKEHNDESLRDIKLKNTQVSNWDNYDTILIGYPIWWGIAAWPINNFVKENDFMGKKVFPFCTSASSGLGQSGELLEKMAKGGTWKEGHRFSSGASTSEIKKWTDSLK